MRQLPYLILLLSLPLWAQPPAGDDDFDVSLGFAVLANDEGYRDADNDLRVIPLLDLRYKRFYFQGIQAGLQLVDGQRFSWDVLVRPEFTEFEESESPVFAGMEDRDLSVMAGTKLDVRFPGRYALSFLAEADVTGSSDGLVGDLSLSRTFITKRTITVPSLGLIWQSEDFNNYYFGVRAGEALPERPFYEPGASSAAEASLLVRHRLTERLSLTAFGLWRAFPDEVSDSPLIEGDSSLFGLIGLAWKIR